MAEWQKKIYTDLPYFVENTICLNKILEKLRILEIITEDEQGDVFSRETDEDKAEDFYLLVVQKNADVLPKFLQVLDETGNGEIAEKFRENTGEFVIPLESLLDDLIQYDLFVCAQMQKDLEHYNALAIKTRPNKLGIATAGVGVVAMPFTFGISGVLLTGPIAGVTASNIAQCNKVAEKIMTAWSKYKKPRANIIKDIKNYLQWLLLIPRKMSKLDQDAVFYYTLYCIVHRIIHESDEEPWNKVREVLCEHNMEYPEVKVFQCFSDEYVALKTVVTRPVDITCGRNMDWWKSRVLKGKFVFYANKQLEEEVEALKAVLEWLKGIRVVALEHGPPPIKEG